jgi:glycosyltransferase 2 family protein
VKKFLLRLALSVAIGGAMLYLASKKIDFGNTWSALTEVEWWVLVPYFVGMAVQHFFRAHRWGYLLEPIAPVPLRRIFPIASVGFLAIIALPLRMGELVRPYLIADPPTVKIAHGIGTLAVERVFDGLLLTCTTFIAVLLARRHTVVPGWIFAAGLIAFGIFFTVLVVLVMALWQRRRAVTLCERIFGLISPKLGRATASIAEGIVDGLLALTGWRRVLLFLFETVSYWGLNGFVVWILGRGFGFDLSLWEGTAVMVIVGIGIMIPAGPGFIGNFEFFAQGALNLYAPPAAVARSGAAYILTFHATNAMWYAVTGALALLSPEVSFTKVFESIEKKEA